VFTGLIADVGRIGALERGDDGGGGGEGATLEVLSGLGSELREGDSVAVDGVCLTAIDVRADGFGAQAMQETLARSALGRLAPGSPVNLELPLRAQDRLGGHIVQGHVDGTAAVSSVRQEGFSRVLELVPSDREARERLLRYLVLKGSVAVNGVSLTVSALGEGSFEVALIPETLERTNLGQLEPGAVVNVEVDVLAKHVERLLAART
jgi:riboflavin synthase